MYFTTTPSEVQFKQLHRLHQGREDCLLHMDIKASGSFHSWQKRSAQVSSKVEYKTEWQVERSGQSKEGVGRKQSEQKVHRWCDVEEEFQGFSVTGSGSTAVCCPSARQWWGGRWCPRRCCPETRRVQICLLSASVTRCGRFLQREITNSDLNEWLKVSFM